MANKDITWIKEHSGILEKLNELSDDAIYAIRKGIMRAEAEYFCQFLQKVEDVGKLEKGDKIFSDVSISADAIDTFDHLDKSESGIRYVYYRNSRGGMWNMREGDFTWYLVDDQASQRFQKALTKSNCPEEKVYASDIQWDTDGEDVDLPSEIELPEGITDEDEISDYLSEQTGFCHFGFQIEKRIYERGSGEDSQETLQKQTACKGD